MPTVNIYFAKSPNPEIGSIIDELRVFISKRLTCGDIKLSPEEVSIRLIQTAGGKMIGSTEVEISAASFPERVEDQDKICVAVASFIMDKAPYLGEVQVWLKLSELGHSWTPDNSNRRHNLES